ncbi:MAG: FAD binding domain-containing protein [bacterium]
MSEPKWYYPTDVDSALELLNLNEPLFHAGGTGILMRGFSGVSNIIDLQNLKLNYTICQNKNITLGAMTSFSQVIKFIKTINLNSLLIKSLSRAGTTPLRNRITLGGSLSFLPLWSDLIGPLIALNAKVEVKGLNQGVYPIQEFIRNPSIQNKSLITGINYPLSDYSNFYHRATLTQVGFANFTLSIIGKQKSRTVENLKIVITGTKNRYQKLTDLEQKLIDRPVDFNYFEKNVNSTQLDFSAKELGSSEYITRLAKYRLLNGLQQVFAEEKEDK